MITWLDRILGRLTMYGLVIACLAGLALVAAVLSLLGWFPFGPLELVASAAVLLAVCLGTGRLAGAILRMRPQTSSAIITALLLLFIFQPTLDPAGLGWLALAALVATASKYLVAARGRHVLNPAAAGAFVVGLLPALSGTFVVWWPGTAVMLPFTALGALLVLLRTRRLWLGGAFIAAASLTWGAWFALNGFGAAEGVLFALASYPTVFFAGFMLSEPLTLPPRRWQQLLEAVVVAVLFGVSFNIAGVVSSSPQLALLAGNLLAFAFGQRRAIRLTFTGRSRLTPSSWEFEFRPDHPVRFEPGQFMELTLPHAGTDARGWRRVFSIACGPGGSVRFGVRIPERASSFKRALLELEPGTRVTATGVGGDFVLPADGSRLLLVAGGIGITPFISHLEHLAATRSSRDVALVYAVRDAADLAYAARLAKTPCSITVVAPERPAKLPRGWRWVQAERLTGEQLLDAVPDAAVRRVFLSGSPAWVGELRRALRRAGARRIRTDVFVGY